MTMHAEDGREAEAPDAVPHRAVAAAALGIRPDRATEFIDRIDPLADHLASRLLVARRQAEILRRPALRGIGPAGADNVEDLPQRNRFLRLVDRFAAVLVDDEVRARLVLVAEPAIDMNMSCRGLCVGIFDDERHRRRRRIDELASYAGDPTARRQP